MAESCLDCPSFMPADSIALRDRFHKATGAPMCGRFGYLLGTARSDEKEIEQISLAHGVDCEGYGLPLPSEPESLNFNVAVPVPVTIANKGGHPNVKACLTCVHCVDYETVYEKFGWTVPLCEAKGRLILKAVTDAKGCDYAEPGKPGTDISNLTLLEYYRGGYRVPLEESLKSYADMTISAVDPNLYASDVEVTEAEKAMGIRAWRLINDPKKKRPSIPLPIFDPAQFSEEEQAMIPQTGGAGNPELYVDYNNLLWQYCVEGVQLHETPVLEGEPGTGKTQFARWLAWLTQRPFMRLQFQRSMDVEDILGTTHVTPERGTFFQPGQLPKGWVNPYVVLADEPNLGPDETWQVMRPLTDNSKELIINTEQGPQFFPRHEHCAFLMAMNPSWDIRNMGANELADADQNRLSFLLVERPPEPIERHIIKTYCKVLDDYDIPDDVLDVLMAVSLDIQQAADNQEFPGSWATRQQIKVARKTAWYDIITAYKVAVLNHLEPSVAQLVMNSVVTHTGGDSYF